MRVVLAANNLANVLTNDTEQHRKIHYYIQLDKTKQVNIINTS